MYNPKDPRVELGAKLTRVAVPAPTSNLRSPGETSAQPGAEGYKGALSHLPAPRGRLGLPDSSGGSFSF